MLGNPRPAVTAYVSSHELNEGTYPSLAVLVGDIASQVTKYGSLARMPSDTIGNTRNDMYLASEAIRFLMKDKAADLSSDEVKALNSYKASLDGATKFIPTWVKVAVAIALGLGTMIGWKRIVVTVGEKIGKTHLTYAQGACAEITAAATIAAADVYGLPVSTTHVFSSGIAGTMAANGSGLQLSTCATLRSPGCSRCRRRWRSRAFSTGSSRRCLAKERCRRLAKGRRYNRRPFFACDLDCRLAVAIEQSGYREPASCKTRSQSRVASRSPRRASSIILTATLSRSRAAVSGSLSASHA